MISNKMQLRLRTQSWISDQEFKTRDKWVRKRRLNYGWHRVYRHAMLLCCLRPSSRQSIVSRRSRAPRGLWSRRGRTLCPASGRETRDQLAVRTAGGQFLTGAEIYLSQPPSGDGALLAHYGRPGWPWRVIDDTAWRDSVTGLSNRTSQPLRLHRPPSDHTYSFCSSNIYVKLK